MSPLRLIGGLERIGHRHISKYSRENMQYKYRLLTPGPTPIPEKVKLAMAKDIIHHRKEKFMSIMGRVQEKLRLLFGTKNEVLLLSCSGTGAMQAAVFNLFNRDEKVLIVEGGKFGKRWTEIAKVRSLVPITLEVEWGSPVDPSLIEETLKKDINIKGVLVQASETSTGVLHPIEKIGKITKRLDRLLVVDGISAVGISPCPMDKWHIDCLITGSQKGLMLPPGLALISLSDRAWDKAKGVKREDYYFYLIGEREKIKKGQTLYTSPVSLIVGLDACMDIFFSSTLEEIYKKYWALTQMTREGISLMGLECLAKTSYTWGLTSVVLPKGVDGVLLIKELAKEFNLYIAGGQDHLKGKIIRIGHMGDVDAGDILFALNAIYRVLKKEYNITCKDKNFLGKAYDVYEESLIKGYFDSTE